MLFGAIIMCKSFLMSRIYQYQQYGYSFSTVERLLHAMGGDNFLTLMNQTLEETMMGEGFSQVFINDIVAPIARVNYGQSVRINGFVGMFQNFWFSLYLTLSLNMCDIFKIECTCLVFRGSVISRGRFRPVGSGWRK